MSIVVRFNPTSLMTEQYKATVRLLEGRGNFPFLPTARGTTREATTSVPRHWAPRTRRRRAGREGTPTGTSGDACAGLPGRKRLRLLKS
jgi:hypothetical protein